MGQLVSITTITLDYRYLAWSNTMMEYRYVAWIVKVDFRGQVFDGKSLNNSICSVFQMFLNKTAGHHWYIFHLLALLKIPWRKMKAFLQINTIFRKLWQFCQIQNFSDFCKNPQFRWNKEILWNNIIWYAFYSKFAAFLDFEKDVFFFEKKYLFFKKTQISNIKKSHCFSRIPLQICYHLVIKSFQEQKESDWSNIGHYQLANSLRNVRVVWMIFLPYYMAENNSELVLWLRIVRSCCAHWMENRLGNFHGVFLPEVLCDSLVCLQERCTNWEVV